jgi:hypothetical protein
VLSFQETADPGALYVVVMLILTAVATYRTNKSYSIDRPQLFAILLLISAFLSNMVNQEFQIMMSLNMFAWC